MTAILQRHKHIIRKFIDNNFTDEALAKVYAFNADGKMHYASTCSCLLGVAVSAILHESQSCKEEPLDHYYLAKEALPFAIEAEAAYGDLDNATLNLGPEIVRQRRLSAILRGQMRLRERAKQAQHEHTLEPSRA